MRRKESDHFLNRLYKTVLKNILLSLKRVKVFTNQFIRTDTNNTAGVKTFSYKPF